MASSRSTNNKYASLNFNDIYQKKNHPSSSSPSSSSLSSPKTILSNSRIHGNMLVLTRPSPKPIPQPSPPSTPPPPQQQNQQPPTTPDPISLRPLGRTGSGPTLTPSPPSTPPPPPPQQQQNQQPPTTPDPISLRPLGRTGSGPTLTPSPLTLPKPDKDYSPSPSPKSGRFVPPHLRPGFAGREEKPGPQQGVRSREYGENGRPKSGGGYERVVMRGAGDKDLLDMNRPGSSGNRPSSSG